MKNRTTLVITVLTVILFILIVLSIVTGSVNYSFSSVLKALFKPSEVPSSQTYIIRNLRVPRTLCGIFAGAALAFCGLVFQTVFRNPMADSYILGISSGASASVGIAMLTGIMTLMPYSVPFWAFTGSFLATLFLFVTGKRNPSLLLLTGISLNFFLSAITTLTIYLGKHQLDSILFWTMGSISSATWLRSTVLGLISLCSFLFGMKVHTSMDILLTDDSTAISSGLNIRSFRMILLFVASAITAIAVAFCGVIGFVGLMSPHFARIICTPRHKKLIPASMLLGADILLFADLVSRNIVSPSELPIGLVTSLLGAPVFFVLLRRRKKL